MEIDVNTFYHCWPLYIYMPRPTPKEGYVCPYSGVEVAALAILASKYPVSASWLLTGRGRVLTLRS